ncbi:MAG: DUF308 domain-containing protein [Clostridiales bacterium]|nr:DUF308 domain-containing protein [Clostridiales bacterium]
MENRTKNIWLKIALFALECVLGIILLVDPVGVTKAIIITAGILCLIYAVINIVYYFKLEPLTASLRQCLFKGLLAAVFGGFCLWRSEWFIATFPIFTIIYGIGILIAGLFKLQAAVDLMRFKQKWGIVCLSAVISIIFAAVILINPFVSTAALWMFVGISLVLASIIDLVSLIAQLVSEKKNKNKTGMV